MMNPYGPQSERSKRLAAKAAYSKAARKKLIESRAKLDGVKAAIKNAIATGQIESSERLERAQRAMDAHLATAESRIERLRKSGDDAWEDARNEVDNAWEDLSQLIKKLVARLSDESR